MAKPTVFLLVAPLLACQPDAAVPSPPVENSVEPSSPTMVHHAVTVTVDPAGHRLTVEDELQFPSPLSGAVEFELHGDLNPQSLGKGHELDALGDVPDPGPVEAERYRISPPAGTRRLSLKYEGVIHHPLTPEGTVGLIGEEGVYLTGATRWLPALPDVPQVTFEMEVVLPAGWRSLSQGTRTQREEGPEFVRETWTERAPQQEVYLIAGQFTEYRQEGEIADAVVLLRTPDEELAQRYLGLTEPYLEMYAGLVGSYPYSKFALVENFWETGYGMPSFTALGPRVMRMPFIPFTSYPHEILHNWWGNGVYVDYEKGNWCEGLTTYLADHLLAEQRGGGAEHRRGVLQRYADYVDENDDFALTEFRGRHDAVTQAVGYGKTLMVFHMLRLQLGDDGFRAGLRKLYADNAFRTTDWSAVAAAFASATDTDLDAFFEQWISRPGGPALRVRDVVVSGTQVRGVIEQTQAGDAFALRGPVAVQLAGVDQAQWHTVDMQAKEQAFELDLSAEPVHVAVDPSFDVFRRLHREETPPAISQVFGADQVLIVLPSKAPKTLQDAYRGLAEAWQRGQESRVTIQADDALEQLPSDRAVWVLGWENRFRPAIAEDQSVTVAGQTFSRSDSAAVIVTRLPSNAAFALAWVGADNPAAMPGLARKLPHYGKYGYLAFTGDEPQNSAKGLWPVTESPLSVALGESGQPLVLGPRPPLATLAMPKRR